MVEMYVKVYKRKKQKGTYVASVTKRSNKKGKAIKVTKINMPRMN